MKEKLVFQLLGKTTTFVGVLCDSGQGDTEHDQATSGLELAGLINRRNGMSSCHFKVT
jgi:hypothetical protein